MSQEASVGIVEPKTFTFAEPPNEMLLEGGAKLGPVTLAYESYGELNADCTNAVLITHALSGDAHVAGYHSEDDRKPGWWDDMVGPGKAFDTERYFVLCSNVIGGCQGSTGPSSINPATGKPYGLDFPVITVGDMVNAQHELVRHLGIQKLLCVAGGSMGGMQALDWASRYPDELECVMVIASTHLSGAQQIAFDAVGRNAIRRDDAFQHGQYYDSEQQPDAGLSVARMLAHITYLSEDSMRAKFGRDLRDAEELSYDMNSEFAVETYLDYQGAQFVNRFDANTYLYVTKAMDYFDLSLQHGSLEAAMAKIKARVLVLSYSSDWLYPPYQSQEITYTLAREGGSVTYCNIASEYGHDAFLLEVDVMRRLITGFLDHVSNPNLIQTQPLRDNSETGIGPPLALDESIFEGHRVDYDMIIEQVEPGSKVLDVGCGDGELLVRLIRERDITPVGMELRESNVVKCTRRGVPVIHADVDEGLSAFADQSFDYVLLSMTLQVVKQPDLVLREMLRVGKKVIVSFPNFAFWRVRLALLTQGRAPVTRNLPYSWNRSPNRHVLSIVDFREFCARLGVDIEQEIPLGKQGTVMFWPNLLAEEALYVISGEATD